MRERFSTKLDIGFLSGVGIGQLYSICHRYNVDVITAEKMGGIFVKTYFIVLEGETKDLRKVKTIFGKRN